MEQPAWKDLVDRGTSDLDTALGEPIFLQRNLPNATPAAVEAFRRELRQTMAQRTPSNRLEARDSALAVGEPWPSSGSACRPPPRSWNTSAAQRIRSTPIRPTSRPISSAKCIRRLTAAS